jgi:hypothetical protein
MELPKAAAPLQEIGQALAQDSEVLAEEALQLAQVKAAGEGQELITAARAKDPGHLLRVGQRAWPL